MRFSTLRKITRKLRQLKFHLRSKHVTLFVKLWVSQRLSQLNQINVRNGTESVRGNVPVFQKNVVVMFLSFKQATTAWNKLIEYYKRHRRKMLIVFHSRSRFSLTTTQLIYFRMIQSLVLSFATSTNSQPGTFKCARARSKNCAFVRNVEKISWPKDKKPLSFNPRIIINCLQNRGMDAYVLMTFYPELIRLCTLSTKTVIDILDGP